MPPTTKKIKSVAKKKVTPKKKVKEPSVVEKVVEEVVTPSSTIVEDVPVIGYAAEFQHITGQIKIMQNTLKELMVYSSKLEKRVARDHRELQKKATGKKRRKVSENKGPSGFSKPGPVSDELRKFLGLGKTDEIARTEVTKRINAYCKENNLQASHDKRILKADATLKSLLRLKKGEELTFFNLQKYMKVHFPNKEGVYPTA